MTGRGIEFGALHNPLPVNSDNAKVYYADRLPKEKALDYFPELVTVFDHIIEPDFLIDLDQDDLSIVNEEGFDFIIASTRFGSMVFLRPQGVIHKTVVFNSVSFY